MSTASIHVVVAEDEPLAREALVELVRQAEGLALVGVFADGATALEGIDALEPDVAFLDIRMPAMSGLQVVERMRCHPLVVFTTAYEQHAISAFELGAIDYILKPFDAARFARAHQRIRGMLVDDRGRDPSLPQRLRAALHPSGPPSRIFVRAGPKIIPVEVEAIVRVVADGDYCNVHVDGGPYMVGTTLGTLERILGEDRFIRVHRAHLVNVAKIASIVPYDERRLEVRLEGGVRVVASRAGSKRLRDLAL